MEPNDEQLLGLMPHQLRDDLATVSRMAAHGAGPDVTPELFEGSLTAGALQFARAVLARWGSTLTPVPVSERLPGPGDCDDDGTCWVWNRTAYTWGLFRLDLTAHSHWLPAHALPLPAGEVQP